MTTGVERKRSVNRLKTMYPLRALVDEMYEDTAEAQKEGRPVAWCMQDEFHSPFLNAMGIESVYPENYGTVSAASGEAQLFVERSQAEGFPPYVCGYAQNCLGYTARMAELGGEIPPEAPLGGMPNPMLLISSGAGCDARFKWFQALGRYLDAPQWVIETPGMLSSGTVRKQDLMEGTHDREVDFLVKELKEFAKFLENLIGKKMDWDKFSEDIDSMMAMDAVWYEINQLRKAVPGPMHSRDFWSSMAASVFRTKDPKAVKALYEDMRQEVKDRVANTTSGINYEEKYRMIFIGLPPWHGLNFFDQLAERGWNFVTEHAYHPARPIDLSGIVDPVERLVRYRHQEVERQIDAEFEPEEAAEIREEIKCGETGGRLSFRDIREFKIDGAFLHPLVTCRMATAGLTLQASQIMQLWKVPSLVIEGDIVDTRAFDPVEAMRKAEAFEETMDHYREVRKAEGLEW